MILDISVKIARWKANYQRMKLITYSGDFVSDLEKIENFVLNNMGNKKMMMLVRLRETAQTYYLKCEKLEAENSKLRECVEFYADQDNYKCLIENQRVAVFVVNSDTEPPLNSSVRMVGGKRARQLLKGLEDK